MPDNGQEVDVPVFVDVIASEQAGAFVRVSYLTIECDDPSWGWRLALQTDAMPIALLGLSAVVLRPFDDLRFRLPSQFDDLIRRVEFQRGFAVETGDLWLPPSSFESAEAGHVLRMSATLFGVAHQYRYGHIGRGEFEGVADRLREGVSFSAEETRAYHEWHEQVTHRPPVEKKAELRLRTRGEI